MWQGFEMVTAKVAVALDRMRPAVDGRPGRHRYHRLCRATDWLYRAVDQFGQVIDVMLSDTRDLAAARSFFEGAQHRAARPVEVTTDKAASYPSVIDELAPEAFHDTTKHANNRCEADHGRLKARLRPMRGLKTDPTAKVIVAGHAFIQNLRRRHYELGTDEGPSERLLAAFDELQHAI